MQKALILALLIGAFLLPRYVTGQENPGLLCPDGDGTFQDHPELGPICSAPAPIGTLYRFDYGHKMPTRAKACDSGAAGYREARAIANQGNPNIIVGGATGSLEGPTQNQCRMLVSLTIKNNVGVWVPSQNQHIDYTIEITPSEPYCPPDESPTLIGIHPVGNGSFICWKEALDEPPEECDDIVGNCEPDPECVNGGNGMQVCAKDPDETCDSYTHNGNIYYDCPVGCGFIQGTLYCTTEPDSDGEIPDLSNCFKIATGWACPPDSPTPDDNIDNPEKPLPDMNKGDFKQVNIGIETRLDGTNKLLGDIAAIGEANAEGLADLNSKALAGNKKLDDIIKNTGATVDALTADGESADMIDGPGFKSEIARALGITGEESIEDLTVAEVDLDDFKGEFTWSIGSSQCPQPRAINMLGRTFYMDWNPFCQAFTVMGYLILAAAYFFSTIIAFKGK